MKALTADEAKRIRIALIFGDPAGAGSPDPKLEEAKRKLREIEVGTDPYGYQRRDDQSDEWVTVPLAILQEAHGSCLPGDARSLLALLVDAKME